MNEFINIGIVDDNYFLIQTIEEKLSFFNSLKVVLKAKNGEDLINKLNIDDNIDIILMDIDMPIKNGIEATLEVKEKYPKIKIIMLTVFDNDENIFNAIKAGADGYLLKEIDPETLHQSILETLNGGAAMTPSIALKTIKLLRSPVNFEIEKDKEAVQLSDRELEVLEHLSKGLNYNKIAENLYLSPHTIRKHIENIYSKLQVHSKLEAVQKARRNNLI